MSFPLRQKSPIKRFFKFFFGFILTYLLVTWLLGELPKNIQHLFHIDIDNKDSDSSVYSTKIPQDYLDVLHFKQGCCTSGDTGAFHLINTTIFKIRKPISGFLYDQKYYLQISLLDSTYSLPLSSNIIQNDINVDDPLYSYYAEDEESNLDFFYKLTSRPEQVKPQKIYLNLIGKDTRKIFNSDTITCYYSSIRKFSVQYDLSKKYEIYGVSKGDGLLTKEYQPFEMLFLKRKNRLYLLTMTVYKPGVTYLQGMLYNLVK